MERVYTPEQVAGLLQVDEKTVRRWLQRGELKGSMIGRFWRIKESDLEALFARPPTSEPPPVPDTGADR